MFGVVGQVGQIAIPMLKFNLDQDLRQLLNKMVECAQDQVQNQDIVQVRRYNKDIPYHPMSSYLISIFSQLCLG